MTDRMFREGDFVGAAERLKKGLEDDGESGRDQLLYLLDLGLVLHTAGQFEESTRYLLKADKIAEIKDYTSLAAEGATLLASDNLKDYKGEDFEKVMINTYLAMNYALVGQPEDALVEARRVNRKLALMVSEGERHYKQNAFARYLSAVLYEADGNFNDAYVDYKLARKIDAALPGLGIDLWRCATAAGMTQEREEWEREYDLSEADKRQALELIRRQGNLGEIIVLYENGISPRKAPHPSWHEIPKFYPRPNPVAHAQVFMDGVDKGRTHVFHDIETTAIANLDEKYAGIIAKKVAGAVAKYAVGQGVEAATKSKFLGQLTRLALHLADQADIRSWALLPRDLQIARFSVPPGVHTVRVVPVGAEGDAREKTVHVGPRRKVFVNVRYMP